MEIGYAEDLEVAAREATRIASELPEWFTDKALVDIRRDIMESNTETLVARDEGRVVGFLVSTATIQEATCEIKWMGVARDRQREGIGWELISSLIGELEDCIYEGEVDYLVVTTLADSVDYEPYEQTRAFYRKAGFRDREIKENFYPDGGDGVVMRKWIGEGVPEGFGDCYFAAAKLMEALKDSGENMEKYRLVHGEATMLDGTKFGHAWVERTDPESVMVLDSTDSIESTNELPKEIYYNIMQIYTAMSHNSNTHSYTYEEMNEKLVSHKHFGPWDLQTETGL